jgi:hypothetical protein
MRDVIRKRITLLEWLGHMSLFHANVHISNVMIVELCVSNEAIMTVHPHTLNPGYSHLYSIP